MGYSKLKDCVRLLFWSGQSFKSSGLKPEGKFKAAEARFNSVGEVDTAALHQWFLESRNTQWDCTMAMSVAGWPERQAEQGQA